MVLTAKNGRRFGRLVMVVVLLFLLTACGGQSNPGRPGSARMQIARNAPQITPLTIPLLPKVSYRFMMRTQTHTAHQFIVTETRLSLNR